MKVNIPIPFVETPKDPAAERQYRAGYCNAITQLADDMENGGSSVAGLVARVREDVAAWRAESPDWPGDYKRGFHQGAWEVVGRLEHGISLTASDLRSWLSGAGEEWEKVLPANRMLQAPLITPSGRGKAA